MAVVRQLPNALRSDRVRRLGRGLLLNVIAMRWTYAIGDRRARRKDRRWFLVGALILSAILAASMGRAELFTYGVPFFTGQFLLLELLERRGDREFDDARAARRQAYRDARIAAGFLPADESSDQLPRG